MTPAVNRALGLAAVVASTVRLVDSSRGVDQLWPWWAYALGFACGLILLWTPDRPPTELEVEVRKQADELLKKAYMINASLMQFQEWIGSIDIDVGAAALAKWLDQDWETLPDERKSELRDAVKSIVNSTFPPVSTPEIVQHALYVGDKP